jgi:hypothetical protein
MVASAFQVRSVYTRSSLSSKGDVVLGVFVVHVVSFSTDKKGLLLCSIWVSPLELP